MAEMFLVGWRIAQGRDYQEKWDKLTEYLAGIGGEDTGATSSYVVPSGLTPDAFCKSIYNKAGLTSDDALIVAPIENFPVGAGDVNPKVVKRVK